MKSMLQKLGLNPDNSVVIGSGILQALGIRNSKDIDLVTSQEMFDSLSKSGNFSVTKNHGRNILKDDLFEIGTEWNVLGKSYKFENFLDDSIVIEGVRYITLDFLLKAKKSWINEGSARKKDIEDVKLIEKYIKNL